MDRIEFDKMSAKQREDFFADLNARLQVVFECAEVIIGEEIAAWFGIQPGLYRDGRFVASLDVVESTNCNIFG